MGIFWTYTLKVAICLLFFFVFNKLILSRETFHKFNRVVWLLVLGASLILPIFDWKGIEPALVEPLVYEQELIDLPVSSEEQAQVKITYVPTIVKYSLLVYFGVAVMLALKLLYSYICLFRLILFKRNHIQPEGKDLDLLSQTKGVLKYRKNVNLIVHQKELSPFSWMNYIVVSKNDINEDGREILIHELSHIKNKHSWDLIFTDLLIVFQWFNPAAWLYKRSLQEVHEYSADESVLQAGVNAKQYQLLLIKKAVGQRLYSMANSFNHSKLKNRITMMLKEKSNKWAVAKCLYALPLAFFAISAFANPEVSNHFEDISAVEFTQNSQKKKDPLYIVDGKKHSGSLGDLNPKDIQSMTVLKAESATAKYGRKGKNGVIEITLKDASQTKGVKEESSVTVVKLSEEVTNVRLSDRTENRPLIIIDGEEYSGSMNDIDPKLIKSIDVLKDKGITVEYGEKGKDGVIIINSTKLSGKVADVKINAKYSIDGAPYILVNGEEGSIQDLNPLSIKSMNVIKGKKAEEEYGEKGKNGVIIITLKDPETKGEVISVSVSSKGKKIKIKSSDSEESQPYILVNGKEYEGSIAELSPMSILSTDVLKGKVAVVKYGEKGKNGVIIITTKDPETTEEVISVSVSSKGKKIKIKSSDSKEEQPYILVNGKEYKGTLQDINAGAIKSMSVIKGIQATEKYGEKGKNGVVEVTLKQTLKEEPKEDVVL